jgi:adenylate cyclase class IV
MNENLFKIDRHIIFELAHDGKDELTVIARPETVRNFLSRFPNFVQRAKKDTDVYYSWSEGKFDENENIFNLSIEAGQDQLSIITATDALLNFFSCLIVHFKETPEDPNSNYFLKYKGNFKQS